MTHFELSFAHGERSGRKLGFPRRFVRLLRRLWRKRYALFADLLRRLCQNRLQVRAWVISRPPILFHPPLSTHLNASPPRLSGRGFLISVSPPTSTVSSKSLRLSRTLCSLVRTLGPGRQLLRHAGRGSGWLALRGHRDLERRGVASGHLALPHSPSAHLPRAGQQDSCVHGHGSPRALRAPGLRPRALGCVFALPVARYTRVNVQMTLACESRARDGAARTPDFQYPVCRISQLLREPRHAVSDQRRPFSPLSGQESACFWTRVCLVVR